MEHRASQEQIARVVEAIERRGCKARPIPGGERTAIGVLHNKGPVDTAHYLGLPGVKEVIPVTRPYKLVSREFQPTSTIVRVGDQCIMEGGNTQVVLCERGVRTFVRHSRNTLDLSAVPYVCKESHLPIIVDPSHAAGRRSLVIPMARAAVVAEAHGITVEVHHEPDHALSDGAQSLYPDQLATLMAQVQSIFETFEKHPMPEPQYV